MLPLLATFGVLPHGHMPADPEPSWVGLLIGAVFMAAGFIAIMRGVTGASDNSGTGPADAPRALRLVHDALSVSIVCGLAMLFSWVTFGPGPRHFSVGVGGLFTQTSGSSDTIGRVASGLGAILIWCFTAAIAVKTLRAWRR